MRRFFIFVKYRMRLAIVQASYNVAEWQGLSTIRSQADSRRRCPALDLIYRNGD